MEYNLHHEIKEVLHSKAEGIEIEDLSFEQLKKRIEGKKVGYFKTSQLVASFILGMVAVIGVVPSIRIAAMETIQKMIYIPVKKEKGSGYEAKAVPADSEGIITGKATAYGTHLSDEELSQQLGVKINLPENLGKDIMLNAKGIIDIEVEGNKTGKSVCASYRQKEDALSPEFIVSINTFDSDLSQGDNLKQLNIKGIEAYYKEFPVATNQEAHSDPTIKPESYIVGKEICWKLNGLSYSIAVFNESVSFETLLEKAEILIEYYQ